MFVYILSKILKKARLSSIKNSKISPLAVIHSGSSVVNSCFGRYTYCGYDCNIFNAIIGSFCSIAGNVTIGGAVHPMHFVSTSPVFLSHRDSVKKKFSSFNFLPQHITHIGNDVWIGEGAFIKAGVKIGDGSVIGMGAVVTKNVEPYTVVAGNPARVIRQRFDSDVVDGLLKLQWWNMLDEDLQECAEYFDNPIDLLKFKGLL